MYNCILSINKLENSFSFQGFFLPFLHRYFDSLPDYKKNNNGFSVVGKLFHFLSTQCKEPRAAEAIYCGQSKVNQVLIAPPRHSKTFSTFIKYFSSKVSEGMSAQVVKGDSSCTLHCMSFATQMKYIFLIIFLSRNNLVSMNIILTNQRVILKDNIIEISTKIMFTKLCCLFSDQGNITLIWKKYVRLVMCQILYLDAPLTYPQTSSKNLGLRLSTQLDLFFILVNKRTNKACGSAIRYQKERTTANN